MLRAAFRSAFSVCPHATHSNFSWDGRFSAVTCPQQLQVWLVNAGGTATSATPRHAALYWSIDRAMLQPLRRMDRFKPAFARTLLPGASTVPAADAVMAFPSRASIAIRRLARTRRVVS